MNTAQDTIQANITKDSFVLEEYRKVINTFALKYEAALILDPDGKLHIVKQDFADVSLLSLSSGELYLDDVVREFADKCVYGPDRESFLKECNNERLQSRSRETDLYVVEFRYLNPNDGTRPWCEIVVRGMPGQKVLLAIRKHDKEITSRRVDEKLYSEYASIFLVDIPTDTFRFIYRNPESGFADVPGGCYSDTILEYASRVHPDYRNKLERLADLEAVKGFLSKESRFEYIYPLEGANKRWRRCVIHLLDSEDGVPVTFIMTYITIDDRRSVEFELHSLIAKQKAQLEEQQKQLQQALLEAQAANNAKTVFMNNMSHDIRTPLNAIVGFTGLALKDVDTDAGKTREYLEKVATSSSALLEIINDILDISSIEAGKLKVEEEECDLLCSFANIESMMSDLAAKADLDLQFSYGEIPDRYVLCDRVHCTRIFTNLISNAIKYTPAGGWVKVYCEQVGRSDADHGLYRYTVEDNGIGMSTEFQKNLFDRFAREGNTTVTKIQGMGLGLALCRNLVDCLGGTIEFESEKGKGTKFIVTLPYRISENQEPADSLERVETDTARFAGKKVLLVEDNELNREISTAILEEFGFIISCAEDGDVAVDMVRNAKEGDYDIVLMDIQMPTLNGYDATRQIRALGTPMAKVPIVAMTANAFSEDRIAAIEAGMDGHIAKPIDIRALCETISSILTPPPGKSRRSPRSNCL